MAAPMEHMECKHVEFTLKSGASLVKTKPIFSHDSKYLLVCSGTVVKVYSTLRGECVRELSGHQSYVTGLVIHPNNRLRVVSCSLDQTVRVWDYLDGILFQTIPVPSPLYGIYTSPNSNMIFLIEATKEGYNLMRRPLMENCDIKPVKCMSPVDKDPQLTAVSPHGHFTVTVTKNGMKWAENKKKGKTASHMADRDQTLTCITCHPNEKCVATGCSDGKIVMWYKFDSADHVIRTTVHWHSLAVRDICYTLEGSYLLSGGYECVLVKMHQESKYKDFLPRLGADIKYVVCSNDNMNYAVCLDDNSIQVISSSLGIEQVFQGLTRGYLPDRSKNPIPVGLMIDPRSQALVTNGKLGHLQFFSVQEDRQLYNLDIVSQNFISPDNLDNPLSRTIITSAAFDSTGTWLSTAEYWDDGEHTPDVRLKFWKYQEENQRYTLITVVESPHKEKVEWLKIRPPVTSSDPDIRQMAVSASRDGKFRTWTLVDDTDMYRQNEKWTCLSVGYYRDLPTGDLAFSEDGSLLAVVFGSVVTLWEPENNLLKGTLATQHSSYPVLRIEFGSGGCCQYLVTSTVFELTVWNLLSMSVCWSVNTRIQCLTADPKSGLMVTFTANKELIVFRPSDPKPVATYEAVSNSRVLSAVFIPHTRKSQYEETSLSWQSQSELFFMNIDQELVAVGFKTTTEKAKTQSDVVEISQNLPQSALSLLMKGHTNTSGLRVSHDLLKKQSKGKYLTEIFQSASHVQPSVQALCRPFIQSLLVPTGKQKEEQDEDEGVDEDEQIEETMLHDMQTGSLDSGVSDMDVDSLGLNQSMNGESAESSSKTVTKHGGSEMAPLCVKPLGDLNTKDLKLLKTDMSWYIEASLYT